MYGCSIMVCWLCVSVILPSLVSGVQPRHVIFVHNKESNSIEAHDVAVGYDGWKYLDPPPQWIVDASYHDDVEKNGWGVAEFTLNPDTDPKMLAYGAGYADGYLTSLRINQNWNNTKKGFCDKPEMSPSCKKIHDFLQDNLDWMKSMIEQSSTDPYWNEVNKVLLQVQGVADAYNNEGSMDLTIRLKPFGLLLLQLDGDIEELETALNVTERFFNHPVGSGSCSALIKLTEDKTGKKDLLSAHDTWDTYETMLRIMKRFNFPSHSEAFSGYPGSVYSGDDFYILSSGLVTIETTIGNSNPDLWRNVNPKTVLEWMRNIVANRLAKNGEEWCKIFEQHNSGTYNNQWMIVDYNAFESQKGNDILYVLEQLPGQIVYKDVTDVLLNKTYWPSYNIPYFESIFNNSGQPAMVKKYGDWFTYDKNPRARMFARDHKKVTDMDSLIKLMRYNDFKNDPISRCNCTPPYSGENTIAARSDLNLANGSYPFGALAQRDHGATDVKATSATLRRSFAMIAECGPTHDQQPVFAWSKSPYASKSHLGHPDKFDFKPELITWGK